MKSSIDDPGQGSYTALAAGGVEARRRARERHAGPRVRFEQLSLFDPAGTFKPDRRAIERSTQCR